MLEHVSGCWAVCQQLDTGVADSSDPTPSLLALYEFEAKLHLGHPELEGVLERVSSMSLAGPKTFETIAGGAHPTCKSACHSPPPPPSHTHPHPLTHQHYLSRFPQGATVVGYVL